MPLILDRLVGKYLHWDQNDFYRKWDRSLLMSMGFMCAFLNFKTTPITSTIQLSTFYLVANNRPELDNKYLKAAAFACCLAAIYKEPVGAMIFFGSFLMMFQERTKEMMLGG